MPCSHCGKARHASKLALKAAVAGDISGAVEQVRQASDHIRSKLIGLRSDTADKPTVPQARHERG